MMFMFPFDYVNDWSSYMAQLHFLQYCGFQEFCPYWYNGFISFLLISPAWFLVIYPFYLLIGNVQVVAFISLVTIFCSFLVLFLIFGKLLKLSLIKRLFWFAFFTGNAIAIGNFVKLGRIHEFFGLFFFVFMLLFFLYYKDRPLDKWFVLVLPIYTLAFLSHQTIAVLASGMLFWFFIIRREKLFLGLIFVFAMILSSFWLVPYYESFSLSQGVNISLTQAQLSFSIDFILQNLGSFIIPFALFVVFLFYLKTRNWKKEVLFFFPVLALAFLMFFRLISYLPVLNYVYPDSYNYLFLFFILYFFVKIRFGALKPFLKKTIFVLVIVATIGSILISVFYTPFFVENSQINYDTIDALNEVDGMYLIFFGPIDVSYHKAYYSYAAIYLNLSTSSGWYSIPSPEYHEILQEVAVDALEEGDCETFVESLDYLNTTEIITYDEHCETLNMCGFTEKFKKNSVCLYENVV